MTNRKPIARPIWKRWLFRLLAVALGLAPLFLLETACVLFDWGHADSSRDPFVGFSSVRPLFTLDKSKKHYEIGRNWEEFFRYDSFAADKPDDEYRIFVLGGSTVQGRPYAIETSFSTWLELAINAGKPGKRANAVNCGGISYASYRLVPMMEEVLGHSPDLIIVCTGHNEFLEDRTYDHVKHTSPWLKWPIRQASRWRTWNLLRNGWRFLRTDNQSSSNRSILGAEVKARLDPQKGDADAKETEEAMANALDKYHRDDDWREGVIEHFEFNLYRMVNIARREGVPLLFVCPVSNYDFPPFKSQHQVGLSDANRSQFADFMERAAAKNLPDEIALNLLEEAVRIDERFALAHYEFGKRCRVDGRPRMARTALEKALVEDVCPLRMLPPMRKIMLAVGAESDTPIVDAHALLENESAARITGSEWLLDHVHPNVEGHQKIAVAILKKMHARGWIKRHSDVEGGYAGPFQRHLDKLLTDQPNYFAKGQNRLRGLMQWANGRARYKRR